MHGVGFGEYAGFRNVGDGRISVFERGVAQTLAECECRILREVGVTVAVLASNLVVVDRQLSCVTREGDRQASARFGFAENDFGDGLAALHARAWSPQQSRSAFGWSFVNNHAIGTDHGCRQHLRLGADEHHHERLAGFASHVRQCIDQCILSAKQFKRGGGAAFANGLDHIAHHGHDQVAFTCVFHGFAKQCAINLGGNADLRARLSIRVELAFRIGHQIHDVGTARVHDLATFRSELLETIKHGGDHFTRVAVRHPVDLAGAACPVAQLGLGVIGERANDRDTLRTGHVERQ